jgi:hypothetical protein
MFIVRNRRYGRRKRTRSMPKGRRKEILDIT